MVDLMLHGKVRFMVDLTLQLKVHLRVDFKEPLKMHKKVKGDGFGVALDGALEGAFFSAVEDTTKYKDAQEGAING